ncbi:MAG TPA: hypothetical protein V6D08_13610 [Candidatus Obscuribacterales bacterium]
MNSEQIQKLDEQYRREYGKSLRDALMDDPNLSQATKDACEIYLKGSDKRTDADTLKLADIALKEKNMDMFQEAMRNASPEARKKFMEKDENGKTGEDRLKEAFEGHWYHAFSLGLTGNVTDTDLTHAKEYAEKGGLTTATKIRDNSSWSGDNEKAIEKALHDMKPEERQAYLRGRELANNMTPESELTEQQKKDLATYKEIRSALEKAGNETELSRWEDMIAYKDGSLVSKLSMHRGSIYDDSMDDVLGTVENMSKADWERLKKDPHFREEIEKQLKTYLSDDELKRVMEVIDKKAACKTFEEAEQAGRRPILDAIKDAKGYFNDNEDNIYGAIKNMTPEERKKYKEDPEFRKQVDERIKSVLDAGPEQDAAFKLLKQIQETGEKPKEDIVAKLLMHAGKGDTDEAQVVRDLQKAFKEDPTLRDRINNPKTEEDRKFAEEFKSALHKALDDGEYEKYAKPLLEKGFLPAETQMELSKGVFDDDELGAYKDLASLGKAADMDKDPALKDRVLNPKTEADRQLAEQWKDAKAERDKILNDPAYQEKVLGFLSKEEREVALNALKQGEMRPEDLIRAHMVGAGTGEEEIRAALEKLTPAQKEEVRKAYAEKYKSDLTYDIIDEMSGADKTKALRAAEREPTSAREAYNRERDAYYESYDGLGKKWVNNVWDGTGYMSEDAMNEFSAKMTEFSAKFQELPPEQRQELTEKLRTALDQFVESKGAAADALVDATIAVVAVVGAFFTEGVSLSLLAATGFGAALFKVAAKTLLMGSDYELSMVGLDAATGFVDGFLAFLGPAELGKLVGLGAKGAEAAATQAGKTLVKELGETAAKEVIKGGEEALETAMSKAVRDAMLTGSKKVDEKVVERMVAELAKEGASESEKAALRRAIKEGLETGMVEATKGMSSVELKALKYAFIAGGGALGGGGSGMIRGFAEWDPNKSFAENMAMVGKVTAMAAGFGAAGGLAFTAVFEAGGSVFHNVREHFKVKPGERLNEAQLKEAAKLMGVKDGELKYNEQGDLVLTGKAEKPPGHGDTPTDSPGGPHDAPTVPRDTPTTPAEIPASKFPEKTDEFGRKYVEYPVGEGKTIRLRERDGWYYPEGVGSGGDVDRAVKLHVLAANSNDMGRLQKVLLEEIARDPELAKLIPDLKMQDPRLADPAFAEKAGVKVGTGQEQKAFTIAVRSPEDAVKLQKKLEEIFARHPELKLDKPIRPDGLDKLSGESGRVGIVRDFYPQGVDSSGSPGARLDKDLADRIHADKSLEKDSSGRLTEDALRKLEDKTGLKRGSLAYDTEGNLMLKASDSPVDKGKFDRFAKEVAGVGEPAAGGRYSTEQLRQFEKTMRMKEGTFYYNEDGVLMQKTAASKDGNLYLKEKDANKVPRGEIDPRTGKPSEGLEDRFAYYKLADQYGTDPVGSLVYKTGETVKVSGKDAEVIGREGKDILVRPKDAGPPDGEVVKVKPEEIDPANPNSKYRRIGDSDYYADKDGNFYKLREGPDGKELVQDWDAVAVRPENIQRVAAADSPTGPKADLSSDETTVPRGDRSRVASDRPVEAGYRDTGLTDGEGNRIIYRAGNHDVPGKEPVFIDPKNPPEGMTQIKIGDTVAYRDADGTVYRMYRINEGTAEAGTYVPDGNYKVEMPPKKPIEPRGPGDQTQADIPPESGRGRPPESGPRSETLPREAAEDPQMNWAEIPKDKRLEMVRRAERSDLYKAENVDDFVRRANEVTSKWDNRSDLTANFETGREHLVSAYGRYRQEVQEPLTAVLTKMGKSPEEIQRLVGNTDEVRKLLQNEDVVKLLKKEFPTANPEQQLKTVDGLAEARKAFGQQHEALEAVAKERAEQIQKMMDKYAEEHGLPKVKVRLMDEVGANGTYRPGEGILSINKTDVLAAKDPAKLIDTMYHELAHAEQDSLIIRHLVDKAHVDRFPPSKEDLEFIRVTYEAETGRPLTDEHLNRVLEAARDPNNPEHFKPLSDADTTRAKELIADSQKYPWPGEKVAELNNDIRVARSELLKLQNDPNESMRLLEKLGDNSGDSKVLSKRLFGSETPPPEIQKLINDLRDPSKTFDTAVAREILVGRIKENADLNEAWIKDAWQRYFDNPDEQEAWLIGKRAGIAARESNVPGSDPSPAVVKDIDPHPEITERKTLPGIGDRAGTDDTVPGVGPRRGQTSPDTVERGGGELRRGDAVHPGSDGASPRANEGAGDDVLWQPERDITAMSEADRAALKAEAKTPFAKEADMHEFAQTVLKASDKWDDSALLQAQMLKNALDHDLSRAQQAIVEKGLVSPKDFDNVELVRQKLAGRPEELRLYNEYVASKGAYAQELSRLEPVLKPRLDELQQYMNKFMAERGLPPVELKLDLNLEHSPAGAVYDSGKVMIGHELLMSGRAPELIENLYHELTHGEQQNLVLRHLADKLRVKGDFTEADVLAVQKAYNDLGDNVSKEHVEAVLKNRNGVTLEQLKAEGKIEGDPASRAEELMKAFKENKPVGEEFQQLGRDFEAAERELSRLNDQQGARSLTERLAAGTEDSKALSKQLFGTETPPTEVADIIARFKQNPELLTATDAEVYKGLLADRMHDINVRRQAIYAEYMQHHEREAWYAGQMAKQEALEIRRTESPANGDGEFFDWGDLASEPGQGEAFDVPPARSAMKIEAGQKAVVNGREYVVMGEDGEFAMLMRTDRVLAYGDPIPVSAQELASRYTRIGDIGYYRDGNGDYYILRDSGNGGRELVLDPNVKPMRREELVDVMAGPDARRRE